MVNLNTIVAYNSLRKKIYEDDKMVVWNDDNIHAAYFGIYMVQQIPR